MRANEHDRGAREPGSRSSPPGSRGIDIGAAHPEEQLSPGRRESLIVGSLGIVSAEAPDSFLVDVYTESIPTSGPTIRRRDSEAASNYSFSFHDDGSEVYDEHGEQIDPEYYEAIVDEDPPQGADAWSESPGSFARSRSGSRASERQGDSRVSSRRQSLSSVRRRLSSGSSRRSSRRRSSSIASSARGTSDFIHTSTSQRIRLSTEELIIEIFGYQSSPLGYALYMFLCLSTLGIAYLAFRWLPWWRVSVVGTNVPLRDAKWVVIQTELGDVDVIPVIRLRYGKSLSSVFGRKASIPRQNPDPDSEAERDAIILDVLALVDYRYTRFCFHPEKRRFVSIAGWKDPSWTSIKAIEPGLDKRKKDDHQQVFGTNAIEIIQKGVFRLLVDEVLHPFYIFQIASIILWSLDEYYYYATCIFFISIVSIAASLVETRATMKRLCDISRFNCEVRILADGLLENGFSDDLVPGDVFEVPTSSLSQVPCDCLLLRGDCIVNESMLTGESIPVSKAPATDEILEALRLDVATLSADVSKHVLYAGTRIIRARRSQGAADGSTHDAEGAAMAMALRTGFNTTKGALVRSMLFPKPTGFQFYRDSFKYISVMSIVALIGFLFTLVNFLRIGLPWGTIIVRALDLVTIVVPPALPATLTIGTNLAVGRLKRSKIFCTSPQRVNIGGKLDIVCFDKTGTLTEEGLDVLGVHCVTRSDNSDKSVTLGELIREVSPLRGQNLCDAAFESNMQFNERARVDTLLTMATCHSLKVIDSRLLGDPLDEKMFSFTGWHFEEEPGIASPLLSGFSNSSGFGLGGDLSFARDGESGIQVGVIRSFEFVSELRRASVLVRLPNGSAAVYLKGAPENMAAICNPSSFPEDYAEKLREYTYSGHRVIALATKRMRERRWMELQRMDRASVESGLDFLGFIVFENKLKPESGPAIRELSAANIRTVMCTGDNILTAITVALNCGIIQQDVTVFAPRVLAGESSYSMSKLVWDNISGDGLELDDSMLVPKEPFEYDGFRRKRFAFAISGDVFRWAIENFSDDLLSRMLLFSQVFARMSPDEKHDLVERLQGLGYMCGFCGDGANDCGALKAADVGISLSEAEASIAAPFTSTVFNISCVPRVIKEGRAALVTSFSCFKYMSLYSAIQFTSVSFLYISASNLGDFQYLFIDLFLILPVAIFMGWSRAFPRLSQKRPTASLVSYKVLVPLLGQMALYATVQSVVAVAVREQPWFVPPRIGEDQEHTVNSENTALFYVSCFQYILVAVVLSIGPPFREPLMKNVPLVSILVASVGMCLYLMFVPSEFLFELMGLTSMPVGFKVFLVLAGFVGFGISYALEKSVLPRLAAWMKHHPLMDLWEALLVYLASPSGYQPLQAEPSDVHKPGRPKRLPNKQYKRIYNEIMEGASV